MVLRHRWLECVTYSKLGLSPRREELECQPRRVPRACRRSSCAPRRERTARLPTHASEAFHKFVRQSATNAESSIVEDPMRDDSSVRKLVEPTESLFSDTEAPTSCMRPTPFRPTPSTDLREVGQEPPNAYSSSTDPLQTPSLRRVVGPGELPQDPSQAVDAVNELLAKNRVRARASTYGAVPPLAVIAIEPPARRRRNVRGVSARGAFLLVLGNLLGFIAYVFRSRLRQRPARAPSEHRRPHDDALTRRSQSGVRPVAKLPLPSPAPRVQRDIR